MKIVRLKVDIFLVISKGLNENETFLKGLSVENSILSKGIKRPNTKGSKSLVVRGRIFA